MSAAAESVTETLHVSFEIKPTFQVVMTSSGAAPAVRFTPLSPREGQLKQSIRVEIVTNKNQRYSIYQELKNPLLHSEGEAFPKDEIEFMVTPGRQGGQTGIPGFKPVSGTRELIFSSNAQGSSDMFEIIYVLKNETLLSSGDYFGSFLISVKNEG